MFQACSGQPAKQFDPRLFSGSRLKRMRRICRRGRRSVRHPHDRNHGEVKITFGKPSSSTRGRLAFEPRSLVAVASKPIGIPVSTTAAKRKSVRLVTRQMSDVRRLVLVTRMRPCASSIWTSDHLHRPFPKILGGAKDCYAIHKKINDLDFPFSFLGLAVKTTWFFAQPAGSLEPTSRPLQDS